MDARRELDEQVATTVMGWEVPEDKVLELIERSAMPPYSTDIAAAWQVVDQFDGVQIERYPADKRRPGWRVTLTHYEQDAFGQGYGETVELAVCRAALAAAEFFLRNLPPPGVVSERE